MAGELDLEGALNGGTWVTSEGGVECSRPLMDAQSWGVAGYRNQTIGVGGDLSDESDARQDSLYHKTPAVVNRECYEGTGTRTHSLVSNGPGNYGAAEGNYGAAEGNYGAAEGNYGPAEGNYGPAEGNYGPMGNRYVPVGSSGVVPGSLLSRSRLGCSSSQTVLSLSNMSDGLVLANPVVNSTPPAAPVARSGPVGVPVECDRAALLAVVEALRARDWTQEGFSRLVLATDNKSVITGACDWLETWKSTQWINCTANRHLWQQLDQLISSYSAHNIQVEFFHIPREWNELALNLATNKLYQLTN